jgi:hypothetical protein
MNSEDKKLLVVVNKIYARTKDGLLDWEPSQDPNLVGVKLTDYTISINRSPETARAAESFNLAITNSDGLVIQEMDSYLAAKNGCNDLPDLYERARRCALDINGALDDLITELDELSGQR